jgi:hypothetical protein
MLESAQPDQTTAWLSNPLLVNCAIIGLCCGGRKNPFVEWRQVSFLKVEAADPPLGCCTPNMGVILLGESPLYLVPETFTRSQYTK